LNQKCKKHLDPVTGAIVAIIAGTKADIVIEVLQKIPEKLRKRVTEITLDMAGNIFEKTTEKIYGPANLTKWHESVSQSGFKSFNTISRSIKHHYETILNYFDKRSTKASAESFNAKIKVFRSQF